uniref:Uncharacterized protein n=1 Tax=Corethron hystrix TaxID=216773 RepID=A0A7S1B494_9STRA|mmetsp:Transcript_12418/g.27303  ORF Transcript_12418/g.27303 Transcript_12418/m.27303 type:complete len:300 (+) Transcript_12418:176-1075(+)
MSARSRALTAARRTLRTRWEIFKGSGLSASRSIPPLSLYDFSGAEVGDRSADGWIATSDSETIGGSSFVNDLRTHRSDSAGEGGQSYLNFSGYTDAVVSESQSAIKHEMGHVSRTGYCALRSPLFGLQGVDLDNYDTLMVSCRSRRKEISDRRLEICGNDNGDGNSGSNEASDGDGNGDEGADRAFMVGLNLYSYIPGDVYMGYMSIPVSTDRFYELMLPFNSFVLTSEGRLREKHRVADVIHGLRSVTFIIADGRSGEFHLDIGGVYALSLGEDGINELKKNGIRARTAETHTSSAFV